MKNLKEKVKYLIENKISYWLNFPLIRKAMLNSFFIILLMMFSIVGSSFISGLTNNKPSITQNTQIINKIYINNAKTQLKLKLINEVTNYLKSISPNTKLSAIHLVDKCLEYKIDITFVLAQGQMESAFGTAGKAFKTNSAWNVGTFDNGVVLFTYNHPDESLEPYLKLLTEKYLIRISKTKDTTFIEPWDLIKTKSFVSHSGYRYATSPTYEVRMKQLVMKINTITDIKFYQNLIEMSTTEFNTLFYNFKNFSNI